MLPALVLREVVSRAIRYALEHLFIAKRPGYTAAVATPGTSRSVGGPHDANCGLDG